MKPVLVWSSHEKKVHTLYFGKEPKDTDLDNATGQYFRTPGEDDSDRSYIAGDYLFYGGNYCPNTKMKIVIKPAFWVSLK